MLLLRSRSIDEDLEQVVESGSDEEPCSLADVAEDSESDDSETANEVEVSEKTLKFKISTEGGGGGGVSSGRRSYPSSRKGSRERGQHLNCHEVARAVQGEKDRRRFIGGLSFDQRTSMGKKLSFDTPDFVRFNRRREEERGSLDGGRTEMSAAADEKRRLSNGSRLRQAVVTKQNTLSAELMMDVCESSLIAAEKQEKSAENLCDKRPGEEDDGRNCSACKYDDKITVDNTKLMQGDGGGSGGSGSGGGAEPKGRSLLQRLKQLTERLGIRDGGKLGTKGISFPLKNNNGTRMTLPLRQRGKGGESACCKVGEVEGEPKKASTLPKTSRFSLGSKRSWKQRLLGRERPAASLDAIASPAAVSTTATSDNNSVCSSPRCDKEKERPVTAQPLAKAYEPDPHVLNAAIELM